MEKKETQEQCMIFLNGTDKPSFRCEECKANVFTKIEDGPDGSKVYECNSCKTRYVGE